MSVGPQLELFARRESFHPKNNAFGICRHPEITPLDRWNLSIHEEVLELGWRRETQWLKSVSRLPVPEFNNAPDSFGVELFVARSVDHRFWKRLGLSK